MKKAASGNSSEGLRTHHLPASSGGRTPFLFSDLGWDFVGTGIVWVMGSACCTAERGVLIYADLLVSSRSLSSSVLALKCWFCCKSTFCSLLGWLKIFVFVHSWFPVVSPQHALSGKQRANKNRKQKFGRKMSWFYKAWPLASQLAYKQPSLIVQTKL